MSIKAKQLALWPETESSPTLLSEDLAQAYREWFASLIPMRDSPNMALQKSLRTILAAAHQGQISDELRDGLLSETVAVWLDLALRQRFDRFWGTESLHEMRVPKSLRMIPTQGR